MHRLLRLFAPSAVASLLLAAGWSGGPAAADTWTLQTENDRLARTDRHYTAGNRASWVSDAESDLPYWASSTLAWLYPFAKVRSGRIGAVLGQNMYTPENIESRDLVRDDRPYAGWLYGAISVHAETAPEVGSTAPRTLDTIELNLGVIGPASMAEQVQNTFHDLIGSDRSYGWSHQLNNEPAVMLVGERRWRSPPFETLGIEADIIPHMGGSLGNVMTHLNGGATARIGQNINVDFGPPHMRPSLSGLAAVDAVRDTAWYVFAGAEARVVARNIFLDGNTFSDSHSVDREWLVGDVQVGAALVLSGVRFAFTHIIRSREFDGQRRADRFSSFSVSTRF